MSRFSDRNLRLTRQRESAVFGNIIMPASMMVGFIGAMVVLIVLMDNYFNQRWEVGIFTVGAVAVAVPVIAFLFRWMRGHFNSGLKKP